MTRFTPFAMFLAAVIGIAALGATALAATRAPAGASAAYVSSALGYAVQLPAPWRRSATLSAMVNNGNLKVGHEVFTIRSIISGDETSLWPPAPPALWCES